MSTQALDATPRHQQTSAPLTDHSSQISEQSVPSMYGGNTMKTPNNLSDEDFNSSREITISILKILVLAMLLGIAYMVDAKGELTTPIILVLSVFAGLEIATTGLQVFLSKK